MRPSPFQRILAGLVLFFLAFAVLSGGHDFRFHFDLNGTIPRRTQSGFDQRVVVLRDAQGHRWVSQVDARGYFFLSGWRPRLPVALFVCDLGAPNDSTQSGLAVQGTDWVRNALSFQSARAATTCRDLAT